MEKLLRSTGVKKIYLLIRPKRGLQTKVRLEELMSARIFDKLKESSPDVMSQVEAVSGDITEPNFGLNEEDDRFVDAKCFKGSLHDLIVENYLRKSTLFSTVLLPSSLMKI